MAEFPDENGRFSCLEEMGENIYIVEGDDEPQQETSSTYPPSTLSPHFSNYRRSNLPTRLVPFHEIFSLLLTRKLLQGNCKKFSRLFS